jgi:TonB-linked SusC/RagA family outer membrane protein
MNWNKVFGKHRINAMLGMSWSMRKYDSFTAYASNFTTDFYTYHNLGLGTDRPSVSSDYDKWAMNSYFMRVGYTYNDRYSATVTAREDGSSKFGENNKYGFFPSVGLAWYISNEKFMKNVSFINMLKLHTSLGVTGNSESDTYESLAKIAAGTGVHNQQTVTTADINNMANPNLKWEKTTQWDLGLNLGLWNDRLNFDVSYYYKKTTDMLYQRSLPYTSGFDNVWDNLASMENKGVDLLVTAHPVRTREFDWTSTINMNYNTNKILSLGVNDEPDYGNDSHGYLAVGSPVGCFYTYVFDGINDSGNNIGITKLKKDANGNAVREVVGCGLPKYTGSFINTFNYKNFDLTVDLQFTFDVDVFQNFLHSTQSRFYTSGFASILNDAWSENNKDTQVQIIYDRILGDTESDQGANSSWVCDGSFLRANQIQLGYTFDKKVLKRGPLSSLRIYANCNNAFLVTSKGFKGYDPESTSDSGSLGGQGFIAWQSYPKPRTFTLGVNVTFK